MNYCCWKNQTYLDIIFISDDLNGNIKEPHIGFQYIIIKNVRTEIIVLKM